jgi:hypothetical protein
MRQLTKPLRLARGLKSVFAATAIASGRGSQENYRVSHWPTRGKSGRAGQGS